MTTIPKPSPAHVAALSRRHPRPTASLTHYRQVTGTDATTVPARVRWELAVLYSGLHPLARLVALALATYTDWETASFRPTDRPGVLRLSKACRLPQENVRRALSDLDRLGWISRRPAPGDDPLIELIVPEATP